MHTKWAMKIFFIFLWLQIVQCYMFFFLDLVLISFYWNETLFSETRENDPFSRCFRKKYICSFETTFDIYFLVAVIANWKGCFLLWQHGTFTETFHTHLFQLWCPTFDNLLEIISPVKVEWGQAKIKFGLVKSGNSAQNTYFKTTYFRISILQILKAHWTNSVWKHNCVWVSETLYQFKTWPAQESWKWSHLFLSLLISAFARGAIRTFFVTVEFIR